MTTDFDDNKATNLFDVNVILFDSINQLRSDKEAWLSDMPSRILRDQLENLNDGLPGFSWNQAIANAAQHFVSQSASCGLTTDGYGNNFYEVLTKYYAFEARNVEFMTIKSSKFHSQTPLDIKKALASQL